MSLFVRVVLGGLLLSVSVTAGGPEPIPLSTVGSGFKTLFAPNTTHTYLEHAERFPFRHRAREYELVNAWWLAEISMLAYTPAEFARTTLVKAGLDRFRFFELKGTQCLVAHNDRFAIVAFRGTDVEESKDLHVNFKLIRVASGHGGKVHQGFRKALDRVWPDLHEYLTANLTNNQTVWFTGHSLGGALATLAADRYPRARAVYTFGSPRVGNVAFALDYRPTLYRFVNTNDVITRVPAKALGYEHVGSLRYLESDGEILIDPEPEVMRLDGLAGSRSHAPILYVLKIWNALYEKDRLTRLPTIRYDQIESLKGRIPRKTRHFEIAKTVRIDGPFYIFEVKADHGRYEVRSSADLARVCHEIQVIEEYRRTSVGRQMWEGAEDLLYDMAQGATKIVTKPAAAGRGIGRSLARRTRMVARLFKKKDARGEGARATCAGGLLAGTKARELAYDLKVDVYSENPYLRALLTSVAQAETAGELGASVAISEISPVPGLGYATAGALTPAGYELETEELIREYDDPELRYQLRKNYIRAMGLDKSEDRLQIAQYRDFLENENFTPREVAYASLYLTHLSDVQGHRETVRQLGSIEAPDDASFIVRQLELYSSAHLGGTELAELVPFAEQLAARDTGGSLVVLAPYDLVQPSSLMNEEREHFLTAAEELRIENRIFWVTGDLSERLEESGAADGIVLLGALLNEPEFRTERTER